MAWLDVHILQNVPPSNINRDDSGSPKTAFYGGVRRARVSSQAWKRSVRTAFREDAATSSDAGRRTRRLPQVIADRIVNRCPQLAEHADAVGVAAASAMFKVKPAKGNPGDRPTTEYLLFFGEAQIDQLVDVLVKRADEVSAALGDQEELAKVVSGLDLEKLGVTGHPGAVALFGRMVADAPETNVDAACQVAHAISTHEVIDQFDYFTAVDDEVQDNSQTGAGMIGSIEFNSATLYRYATVDMRELVQNLDGEQGRALDIAIAFARSFATSMPTGKSNTFANHTRPELVILAVRDDQPVNLVGAFEHPIQRSDRGFVAESAARLVAYLNEQDEVYGTAPRLVTASYPASLVDEISRTKNKAELPSRDTLPVALERVRAELETLLQA
jgi:CRISPR system Cascade subunit CasC